MKKSLLFAFVLVAALALLTCGLSGCSKHEHTYTINYNADGHWNDVTCGCTDVTPTVIPHSLEKERVVEATFDFGGYTEYVCSICGFSTQDNLSEKLSHNFSPEWSFNEENHWNDCTDKGYEGLMQNVAKHMLVEDIIRDSTSTETGLAKYTCSLCSYSFEKPILKKTHVVSLPVISGGPYYVGQPLSAVTITGGEASVAGSFSWTDPSARIPANGNCSITFTPSNPDDAPIVTTLTVGATQLTVNVSIGDNGKSSETGRINVSYGEDLILYFTPNFGYKMLAVTLDGKNVGTDTNFKIENITANHSVTASFVQYDSPIKLNCTLGDKGCYTINGSTLIISGIKNDTKYTISGEAMGSIVIDVPETVKFELELQGFSLYSNSDAPITILSGDKVTISSKNGYRNSITDARPAVDASNANANPAAIYSLVDLDIEGRGELTVKSENNGGIYTKKDLNVKNITLTVKARDNALRGNDSVTATSAYLNITATHGDAIKTTKSNISTKGNQKGTVTISGGNVSIYAAEDGIDAEYDVIVADASTVLNVFTDKYFENSAVNTLKSADKLYIRTRSGDYSYSIKYAKADGSTVWVNAKLEGEGLVDGDKCYYYSVERKSGYTSLSLYVYLPSQTQQGTEYHDAIENIAINEFYDTLAINYKGDVLTHRFTNYAYSVDGVTIVGEHSSKGIKAGNSISIAAGTVNVTAYGDAIRANNDTKLENEKTPTGNVTVSGGTLTLSSTSTAIHADGTLAVIGGQITVKSSYIGLSGKFVNCSGGKSDITALFKNVHAEVANVS